MTPAEIAFVLGFIPTCLLLGAGAFLALRGLFRLLRRYADALTWHLFMALLSRGRR